MNQVGISIFKILLQITRPKTVMLGNIPRTDIFRDLHHYKESMKIPGFLILSIEAPINFANSTYLNERLVITLHVIPYLSLDYLFCHLYNVIGNELLLQRILRWIEEYEAEDHKKQSSLQFVVLEMSGKAVSTMETDQ